MKRILIAGEAGQGLVTVGQILSLSLVRDGRHIVVTQGYMSRIRGGHNTYAIRAAAGPVAAPVEGVDLLVALTSESVELHRDEVDDDGLILGDVAAAPAMDDDRWLGIPFAELVPARQMNIAALGVAAAQLGLDRELVERAAADYLGGKKNPEWDAGREALDEGFTWGEFRRRPGLGLSAVPAAAAGRVMLNGNEAIALGALSAGLKFLSFYPMTPATSVCLKVIAHADEMGVITEQAEDEIAAVNMAVGASYAGAPAMVATSGGGFVLMEEGVSLAAMTETPLVLVLAQRPGPATGLPTRTAQGDLDLVVCAGHGEFPRAVFAPGTVEECFELARRAFAVAEASQGPVFLFTDQFLADSYRAVGPFPAAELPPVAPLLADPPAAGMYRRYADSETGVSPRLVPGQGEALVVADSDEHTADGHLTEDLAAAAAMAARRRDKIGVIRGLMVPPTWYGAAAPETVLVCWGSACGAVFETVDRLQARGRAAAALHFSQVWPLDPAPFADRLAAAGEIISVEGNAGGQLAGLLRRETGITAARHVGRVDGLPLTPEYILRKLAAA
ncbi:MAG: 2-oxoacid:acceptor oxidoreductase subunit alpha [Deltaproteobacteria bacterium]|nr:2-oxoacid:acceptor oxidoreductase subunit alpha [Candidatus Anaeroferrophillacea bacterium]